MDKEKIGAVMRQLVPLARILGVREDKVMAVLGKTVDKMGRDDLITMARVADAASRFLRDEAAASPPDSCVSVIEALRVPDTGT